MSLPFILAKAFHSYRNSTTCTTDIQECLTVHCKWSSWNAFYSKSMNQIIWIGKVNPRNKPTIDVFRIFERGDTITVGELLIDKVGILLDESAIFIVGKEREAFNSSELLRVKVMDLKDMNIGIDNFCKEKL